MVSTLHSLQCIALVLDRVSRGFQPYKESSKTGTSITADLPACLSHMNKPAWFSQGNNDKNKPACNKTVAS